MSRSVPSGSRALASPKSSTLRCSGGSGWQGPEPPAGTWRGNAALFNIQEGLPETGVGGTPDIAVVDLETGDYQSLGLVGARPQYVPTGHMAFVRDGTLWAVAFDADRFEVRGEARPAGIEDVSVTAENAHFAVNGGTVAYVSGLTNYFDPGPYTPEQHGNRAAGFLSYLPVRENAPTVIAKAGTKIPVAGVDVNIVSSAGESITAALPGAGGANPLCATAERKKQDNTPNNYESIGVIIQYGNFRFLDFGDLTWNQEVDLVCPNNLIGPVDVYRTTRHGGDYSGARALVHSVRPRVAVMNNNPTKGGTPDTFRIVKSSPGIQDITSSFPLQAMVASP